MIKSDSWILDNGSSIFNPFNPEQVNPASYDLKLDNQFIDLHTGKSIVADQINLGTAKFDFYSGAGAIYSPPTAILASTWEYIKIPYYLCACVYLKSSLARMGLDHALAGWVDPGFDGNLTLELHAHRDITLHAGQRVIQIVLYELDSPAINPYHGKYKGQTGPTMAR